MGNRLGLLPLPVSEEDVADVSEGERGYGEALPYASTFFLKNGNKFVFADGSACTLGAKMHTTSLMTFHGPAGDQVNYRGDENLVKVKDGSVVTIYANIRTGGQYLSPTMSSSSSLSTSHHSSKKRLRYNGEYKDVLLNPDRFEFIVRKRKEANSKSSSKGVKKSLSFRRLKLFLKTRRSTSEDVQVDTRARTPPPRSSSTERISTNMRPSTPSLLQVRRHSLNHSLQEHHFHHAQPSQLLSDQAPHASENNTDNQQDLTSERSDLFEDVEDVVSVSQSEDGKEESESDAESFADQAAPHPSENTTTGSVPAPLLATASSREPILSPVSETAEGEDMLRQQTSGSFVEMDINGATADGQEVEHQNQQVSQETQDEEEDYLLMGDYVSLESKCMPGHFILAKSNGQVLLSNSEKTYFFLAVPQLRHLLALDAAGNGSQMLSPAHVEDRRVMEAVSEKRERSASEANWLCLLQNLPMDIVYRILQYKGRWVSTARLVCKDWAMKATLHVQGIRVNGEFACISTLSERRMLVDFIRRCKHLTSLRLRNVDDLCDEDVLIISECRFLRNLGLGGCRKLSDECLEKLAQLEELVNLNLAATSVTDVGLEKVYQALPQLTCLNLYGCQNVTLAGVSKVVEMPKLDSLNVRGCRLDKAALDGLQRRFPHVQILTGPLNVDGIYG